MKKLTHKAAIRLGCLVLIGILIASVTYVVFPRVETSGLAAPFAGTISGTVFDDYNGNGTKDTGEPGLSGATVTATDNLGNSRTAVSDSVGNYTLASLAGSTARIEFSTPPSQSGNPSGVYAPGQSHYNFNEIRGLWRCQSRSGFQPLRGVWLCQGRSDKMLFLTLRSGWKPLLL